MVGSPVIAKGASSGKYVDVFYLFIFYLTHVTDGNTQLFFFGRSEAAMEDFSFNMATPTSSHMVGRCFVATETGTYFDGTGFLKAGETEIA